jgi:hypothetical protein
MGSFSVYQELIASQAVTHCLLGHFTSLSLEILLVKNDILEVYEFLSPLRLRHRTQVYGTVENVHKLRASVYELDLILLHCKEAKVTTLHFSVEKGAFSTVALHSFEMECFQVPHHSLQLTVDPDSRCLAGLLPGLKMFVVPLKSGSRPLTDHKEAYLQ